jgi:hypothetical protein
MIPREAAVDTYGLENSTVRVPLDGIAVVVEAQERTRGTVVDVSGREVIATHPHPTSVD